MKVMDNNLGTATFTNIHKKICKLCVKNKTTNHDDYLLTVAVANRSVKFSQTARHNTNKLNNNTNKKKNSNKTIFTKNFPPLLLPFIHPGIQQLQ